MIEAAAFARVQSELEGSIVRTIAETLGKYGYPFNLSDMARQGGTDLSQVCLEAMTLGGDIWPQQVVLNANVANVA